MSWNRSQINGVDAVVGRGCFVAVVGMWSGDGRMVDRYEVDKFSWEC